MTLVDAPTARRYRSRTVLWWLLVLPGAGWAAVRLGGWETGPLVQLLAFTPYVAVWSLFPLIGALLHRRWIAAAVGAVTALALGGAVVPRALAADGPAVNGPAIRVLTANVLVGGADAGLLIRLVRENDVAVLALQEYTPETETTLTTGGLGALLPYRVSGPEIGTTGSAVWSKYPLSATGVRRNQGVGFLQAYATVTVPGAPPVLVESVHPTAPYAVEVLDEWRGDLARQPKATPDGPLRVLLGDFNATLDHAPLRELIRTGYTDAADAAGQGWIGTWGPYDGDPIPPVAIDHVLVDQRIRVDAVSVHDQPRSDHRAVLARITLPAA
jgi:endonuclease/exonuclease/phosphatase family metal-dependent hydrolase